ncbi:unnamed protein product [Moneuplotes crassus]|uniref:RING-type domain-containing protein n=1 Tax=Euplotes crassus TaxID=5936 RepID=A0AAD1X9R4_EUPCR|nr:unnamed protein product [Moneuplotes crassus]
MGFIDIIIYVGVITYITIAIVGFPVGLIFGAIHSHEKYSESLPQVLMHEPSVPFLKIINSIEPSQMHNLERSLQSTDDLSAWDKFGFEILYMPMNLTFFLAIFVVALNYHHSYSTWVFKWLGVFIYILSFIIIHRDFSLVIFKMAEYGFYPPVHIILFIYFFVVHLCSLCILIFATSLIYDQAKDILYDTCIDRRPLLVYLLLAHIIEGVCIIGSFYIHDYIQFITSNIYVVICQNLFWMPLLLYSLIKRKRLNDVRKGFKSTKEWIGTLCISVHLSFTVNYLYIFTEQSHSIGMKICYLFIFLLIHIILILLYIIHQSFFCGLFYSHYEKQYCNAQIPIRKHYSSSDPRHIQNRHCDYCLNSLADPCLEYLSTEELQSHMYKTLTKNKGTYMSPCLFHIFHPECFMKIYKQLHVCPICDSGFGILVKCEGKYDYLE